MQNNQSNTYFNLTCDGIGFVNRPRWVETKKGKYIACTIQALRGDEEDKTRFDVRVVGGKAKEVFEDLLQKYPELLSGNYRERPTVSIGFRIGDLQAVTFETNDKKTGEKILTPTIDGRLLKIKYLKVKGELFYREESEQPDCTEANAEAKQVYGSHRE